MTIRVPVSGAAVPSDAWARWSSVVELWVRTHPRFVGPVRLARVVLSRLGVLAVVAVLITRPEVRGGAGAYLSVYYLLMAWFVSARSKTLSWRFVSAWFTGSLLWSVVIAKVTSMLAMAVTETRIGSLLLDGNIRADGRRS